MQDLDIQTQVNLAFKTQFISELIYKRLKSQTKDLSEQFAFDHLVDMIKDKTITFHGQIPEELS